MFTMYKGVFKIAYVIQSKFLRNHRVDIFIYMYMFVSWKKDGKALAFLQTWITISFIFHPETFAQSPNFV